MLEYKHFDDTYQTEANAQKYGMQVNPKATIALGVLEKLGENQVKYGAPFCPCLPTHKDETVCPCRYMRELKACRCGLYVRPKEV